MKDETVTMRVAETITDAEVEALVWARDVITDQKEGQYPSLHLASLANKLVRLSAAVNNNN